MKTCKDCQIEKPLTEFYHHKSGKLAGKPQSYCKLCLNIRSGKHQKKNWKRTLELNAGWRRRNADRMKLIRDANNAVNNAIYAGKIQRGTVCTRCGKEGWVEAAHFDYSKKMEFVWLCRSCHRKEDIGNPKSKQQESC